MPSDPVDQTWYLHLCYTRSDWNEFCGKVLQTLLHRVPTPGGTQEQVKYENQYAQTLETYRQFFGEKPPADI